MVSYAIVPVVYVTTPKSSGERTRLVDDCAGAHATIARVGTARMDGQTSRKFESTPALLPVLQIRLDGPKCGGFFGYSEMGAVTRMGTHWHRSKGTVRTVWFEARERERHKSM